MLRRPLLLLGLCGSSGVAPTAAHRGRRDAAARRFSDKVRNRQNVQRSAAPAHNQCIWIIYTCPPCLGAAALPAGIVDGGGVRIMHLKQSAARVTNPLFQGLLPDGLSLLPETPCWYLVKKEVGLCTGPHCIFHTSLHSALKWLTPQTTVGGVSHSVHVPDHWCLTFARSLRDNFLPNHNNQDSH